MARDNEYIAENWIESVKLRGFLPSGQGLSITQLLRWGTEESRSYITAFLKSIREEYLVTTLDVVPTTAFIHLPGRAVGGALRSIERVTQDGSVVALTRIEPERRMTYNTSSGLPFGYIFQGDTIEIIPALAGGITIRLAFQQRLSKLVLGSDCGRIESVDGARQITCESIPSSFLNTEEYDLISGTPNFSTLGIDLGIVSANTTTGVVVFSADLPTGLAVGDYLAFSNETPIPQIPTECHMLLAQRVAEKIAESTGSAKLQTIKDGTRDERANALQLLSVRSSSNARVIINKFGAGWRRYRSIF